MVCVNPRISMEVALSHLHRVAFRRVFGPTEVAQWDELISCVALHTPRLIPDQVSCHLESNGQFSTGSLYSELAFSPGPPELSTLWSIKIPLKIRIFLW